MCPLWLDAACNGDRAWITMDLTASILAAAGAPVTPDLQLDGMDLFPILAGRAPETERTLFWRGPFFRPGQAVRAGRWKLVIDGGRPMLFDLSADVGERRNLIRGNPDVARPLRALLDAWTRDVDGAQLGR